MKINIPITENGYTVKEYLRKINFSQKLYKAVKNNGGQFLRNGHSFSNWEVLATGDMLTLVLPKESIGDNITKVQMDLDVVYEDPYFLILNKPRGIAVIPTTKHFNQSLANGIAYYYEQNNIESNIHFINRLDAETTGLIMLAKNRYIHHVMTKDIKTSIQRDYMALVEGQINKQSGIIDAPIKALEKPSILRIIDSEGVHAITHYQVLNIIGNTTLIQLRLVTGRTHQIRVHMKHIGHPVIGDKLYGTLNDQMYLHSYRILFEHPISNEVIVIERYPSWYQENIKT